MVEYDTEKWVKMLTNQYKIYGFNTTTTTGTT